MCSCLDTDIDPLKVMFHLTFVIPFSVSYTLVASIARIVKTVSLYIFVVLLNLDTLFNSKGEFKTVSHVLNLRRFRYA